MALERVLGAARLCDRVQAGCVSDGVDGTVPFPAAGCTAYGKTGRTSWAALSSDGVVDACAAEVSGNRFVCAVDRVGGYGGERNNGYGRNDTARIGRIG